MEDQLHIFDYVEGFVMMNNQDSINGWKSVPFSVDVDQVVSAMSNNMLLVDPDAATTSTSSRVLYYLEPKKALGSHVVCFCTLLLHLVSTKYEQTWKVDWIT
jgi:hypothetical protein